MYSIVLPSEKYKWFHEIAYPLKEALECFDIITDSLEKLKAKVYDDKITYILFGCESIDRFPAKKYIVYQFEQIHAKTDKKYHNALKVYFDLMKNAISVWEYSYVNIKVLQRFGISNVEYKPFGYSPCIETVDSVIDKDIDVLWLGCILQRRTSILNKLKDELSSYKLHFSNGVFSKSKTDLLSRSKIALNIHMEQPIYSCLEVVRIVYLIANKCLVVSEYSGDSYTDNIFKPYVVFSNNLSETITYLLKHPEIINSRTEYAYKWLKSDYTYQKLLTTSF